MNKILTAQISIDNKNISNESVNGRSSLGVKAEVLMYLDSAEFVSPIGIYEDKVVNSVMEYLGNNRKAFKSLGRNKFFSIKSKDDLVCKYYGTNAILSITKQTDHHAKQEGEHTIITFCNNDSILIVGDFNDIAKSINDLVEGIVMNLVLEEYETQFQLTCS